MRLALPRLNVRECVICSIVCLIGAVLLPLTGILLLAFRPIAFGAAIVVLVAGCGLCLLSARFRQWAAEQAETMMRYRGLRLGNQVSVDPHHVWARLYKYEDVVVVGADDLMQATLGPIDKVEHVPAGSHVRKGERLFTLHSGERKLDVLAPVSGMVLGGNPDVATHPEVINKEPFGDGWVVRMRGEALETERKELLRGCQARAWFQKEVDRVCDALPVGEAGAQADAPADLYRRIDDSTWRRLVGLFSAERPELAPQPHK
jgi:glycine cleavage system H protein